MYLIFVNQHRKSYYCSICKRYNINDFLPFSNFRWAASQSLPPRDDDQNVTPISGKHVNGVLTIVVST